VVEHRPSEVFNSILTNPADTPDEVSPDTADDPSPPPPGDRLEHRLDGGDGASPRDRARAAAARHAARHGALPSVSELAAQAEVSRGTAAAALKALREPPNPLHLVPNNPNPETNQ
jgi:hypothetical protein